MPMLVIRLTDEEKRNLRVRAAQQNQNMSDYVRDLLRPHMQGETDQLRPAQDSPDQHYDSTREHSDDDRAK